MRLRKSVVSFSARLTRISIKFESSRCAISPFTERDNVPISRSIIPHEKFMRMNRLPEQPGDMSLTCADISKARKLLGYNPKTKFQDGLPRFVHWFLKSRAAK